MGLETGLLFGRFFEIFGSPWLQDLRTNIRLGWKPIQVANTLAYYDLITITAVKSFIVHVPGSQTMRALSNR
jgi:hypothetical protein